MDEMIACCGLVCTSCPAYAATQANDREALERIAAQWRVEFNAPQITVESVLCDGCLTDDGFRCGHCYECEIRACGLARGVANCAHCADYGCAMLEAFLDMVPEARATLEGIRRQLVA
jgi:hypothetical protein